MNPITRHIKVSKPNIKLPRWVKTYGNSLGTLFGALFLVVGLCLVFFTIPVLEIIIGVKAISYPVHPVNHGGWLALGLLVFSVFWYTFVYAIYKEYFDN